MSWNGYEQMLHVSGTRRRVYAVEEMPTNDMGDFINSATRVQNMINNNLTGLLLNIGDILEIPKMNKSIKETKS